MTVKLNISLYYFKSPPSFNPSLTFFCLAIENSFYYAESLYLPKIKVKAMAEFSYQKPFPIQKDTTNYRLLTKEYVSTVEVDGRKILKVAPEGLELLAREAFTDVSFYLRPAHLEKVRSILTDPEATDNDRFVAYTMLVNQVVSAEGDLPTCQDTGTAIVVAKKGENVFTGVNDAKHLSKGIYDTYLNRNLRYSQVVPLNMLDEKNTGTNLPAQIDIYAEEGNKYEFLFVTKGGGSGNKTFLYQQTKALLTEEGLTNFVKEKIKDLGTSACPPYHLALVIGGTSAESTLAVVKKASAGYLDYLPTEGNMGGQAFRDLEWEQKVLKICQESGIGAQFGGKYFVHDVRVIRLPRHAASCPVGLGVSCSADRNIKAKITEEGIFLEELEKNPRRFMPERAPELAAPVEIDLDRPMEEVLAELSKYPVKTRLNLRGTLIVARDIAHAEIKKLIDSGKPMPDYFKKHPVYYAGPAKTPIGMPSGSFGPTTAGRMDSYVDLFQSLGGSMIMLAKGNRSQEVTDACKKHGGFYLGSIGGPAAILAKESIKSVEIVDFEELGMEAVRKIEVVNFPAFIIVDDKGNDFFADFKH
jgi:fumarate hydratase class I